MDKCFEVKWQSCIDMAAVLGYDIEISECNFAYYGNHTTYTFVKHNSILTVMLFYESNKLDSVYVSKCFEDVKFKFNNLDNMFTKLLNWL